MGKKNKYKGLSKVANQLPVVMRHCSEKHIVSGEQLIKEEDIQKINDKPVDPEKMYVQHYPVMIAINHKRKLKRLVDKYGSAIVPVYAQSVINHDKKSK
jgi:hypothetical protein